MEYGYDREDEKELTINCHEDLTSGFELAIDQLGYKILREYKSECGLYQYYIVIKDSD